MSLARVFYGGNMKKVIIILAFFVSGCFQHWQEPSSKLASQADNYLDNERDAFFYGYCFRYGDALNCLIERDSLEDCNEFIQKARNYQKSNTTNSKRFIKPNSAYLKRLRETSQIRPSTEKEAIDLMKQGFKETIDYFSEHEWSQCSEIAN